MRSSDSVVDAAHDLGGDERPRVLARQQRPRAAVVLARANALEGEQLAHWAVTRPARRSSSVHAEPPQIFLRQIDAATLEVDARRRA